METRWIVLLVLFVVRTVMGLQFQSVASVSPFLMADLGIDYTSLGFLIGLFHLPGFFLAFPGGLLGKRFGDKPVVAVALVLMTIGGLIMGAYDSYALTVVGRLMSGTGSILLNVLLVKMIADWFAGKEIILAMAVLMSSWPLGIALGLISLGRLAAMTSWQMVMFLTAGACTISLIFFTLFYRSSPTVDEKHIAESARVRFSRQEILLVLIASLIWTLFNGCFIAIPSFAPGFLTSIGYSVTGAASLVSMVTWIVIPSIQIGGYIAEKLRRPNLIVVISFSGIGLGMLLVPYWPNPFVLFIWLGLILGPAVGIITAFPAAVLQPENRAAGMGLYYSFYYGALSALMTVTGFSRDFTQSPAAPLLFGGMLIFIAIVILVLFRMLQARAKLLPLVSAIK
jgi:predicted MFS family arabinose efflux permease